MTTPQEIHTAIREEVATVLIGNKSIIEYLTISLLTRGHILLEGVPGVAKTTIANGFARATGLDAKRVQMTPDLLPADITGTQVYKEADGTFELQQGPIFTNILIADEINRATPKTQSALLEAMQEGTVTIEGETMSLPAPFIVVATQNPIEMEGTYELPEAQRDRFQLKATVDLPNEENELRLLERFDNQPTLSPENIERVVDPDTILAAREMVSRTHVAEPVRRYIRTIVAATREHPDLSYGGSPRASLAFLQVAKARATIHDREFVIPEDVKRMAVPVLMHRLVPNTETQLSDRTTDEIIEEIISDISPPSSDSTKSMPTTAKSEDGGVPRQWANTDDK
ncbi:AAA family ATPase [Haladaptatus caseinilyticus]|uniref:AAA family ATPase n=1 Tax=Haladaptatus caseinilyticus TaxID=2993314 RepID=UPI00224AAF66|nr:MoxR family ATPase [Haladaptatus caseinilyticus]